MVPMQKSSLSLIMAGVLLAFTACSGSTGSLPTQPGAAVPAPPPAPAAPKGRHPRSAGAIQTVVSYTTQILSINQTTWMTIFLYNNGAGLPVTNMGFKLTLPGGQFVASSSASPMNQCGGSFTATGGANSISLAGASLQPGADCYVNVLISSPTAGVYQLSMPVGTVTTAQGLTNIPPSPNPLLYVNPPAAQSTGHLYVPVPTRNSIAVYSTAANSGTGTAYVFSDSSGGLQVPNIVAASPFTGNVFVYSSSSNKILEYAQKSGQLAGPAVAATTPPSAIGGMVVDGFGNLVAVAPATGGGAYWYNTALQKVGGISAPAGQAWGTVASDGSSVYFGDENNHQVFQYADSTVPPNNNPAPTCHWLVDAVTLNPYVTNTKTYEPFYIAYAGTQAGLSVPRHKPHAPPPAPIIDVATTYVVPTKIAPTQSALRWYGNLSTMQACLANVIGSNQATPPYGSDLTAIWGLAIDPLAKNAAISTVPNANEFNSPGLATAGVPVWPLPGNTVTTNSKPAKTYVNSGVATGNFLGQPSYGP